MGEEKETFDESKLTKMYEEMDEYELDGILNALDKI